MGTRPHFPRLYQKQHPPRPPLAGMLCVLIASYTSTVPTSLKLLLPDQTKLHSGHRSSIVLNMPPWSQIQINLSLNHKRTLTIVIYCGNKHIHSFESHYAAMAYFYTGLPPSHVHTHTGCTYCWECCNPIA